MFVDTHCHVHESELFPENSGVEAANRAVENGVTKLICVGTSEKSSREAVEFAENRAYCYATIGVHPHDSKDGWQEIGEILAENAARSTSRKASLSGRSAVSEFTSETNGGQSSPEKIVVGIGEIGLDYFYDNSARETQIAALEAQLQLAVDYALPVSFHVRESFDDFWPIFANFSRNAKIRGVLHSFTDTEKTLEKALENQLFIGVNGISTFARDKQHVFDAIPMENMLLETDAPFLTPKPFRGKVNEPAFVRNVAEYHASRRGVELDHLARVTSANAKTLFSL